MNSIYEKRIVKAASLVIKMALGLLFVVSAILKIIDIDSFEIYIYSYHFFSLDFSALVARGAIILELVLGIGLISNCFHKLMWWGSVLMLLGYIGLLCYALVLGRTDNCHCFGDYLQFDPKQSIIKNIVLIILFLLIYPMKGWKFRFQWPALIGMALACAVGVFAVSPPDTFIPALKEANNLNLNRELFDEALQDPPLEEWHLSQGKKVVCIFSSSCDFCKMTAQKLNLMQRFYDFPETDVLYVFMGTEEGVEQFFEESESTRYQYVIYDDLKRLLKINNGVIPVLLLLEDGEIIHEYGFRNMEEREIKKFFLSDAH